MAKKPTRISNLRKEEIVNACLELYKTKTYSEITLKEIGETISVSRPSIYNYFQTKEEIFLAILEQEYTSWAEALDGILHQTDVPTRRALARQLATTLKKRETFIRILAADVPGMESMAREDNLASYKAAKAAASEMLQKVLKRYCSELNAKSLPAKARMLMIAMHGTYANAPKDSFDTLFEVFDKLLEV